MPATSQVSTISHSERCMNRIRIVDMSAWRMSWPSSTSGAGMKHQSAFQQPLRKVDSPVTRNPPSGWRTAVAGTDPVPPPPHMMTRGLSR